MSSLAWFLNANLKTYTVKNSEVLSIGVQSIQNVSFLALCNSIDYFNKYPLIGDNEQLAISYPYPYSYSYSYYSNENQDQNQQTTKNEKQSII